ncbi:MAG: hypothetical protein GX846_07770, partial [Deltaproteobacteria bacterium]|nr:hypothetical protein [Deltaproteobacteria bacterium]
MGIYNKYMVTRPLQGAGKNIRGKSTPVMTYMSNDLVPGCNKHIDISWIHGMPEPSPHIKEQVLDYD